MGKEQLKTVCVVTAARSEYGLLRWIIDNVNNDQHLILKLVVTGSHLAEEYGYTFHDIEKDGYPIAAKVDMELNASTQRGIVKSMGICSCKIADTFDSLNPDILIVLGDRYELLPICSAALLMNIPIAHISGGDITLGALDNEIRNSITMLSTLHFPGTQESAKNIIRMKNSSKNVFAVGEPGLDNFKKLSLMNRCQLSKDLGIDVGNEWILVTVHPETQNTLSYNLSMAKNIWSFTESLEEVNVVITKANADFGGEQINSFWTEIVNAQPNKYTLVDSLGQIRYLSFMKECSVVIGNSSSGIVEAPSLAKPVVNIGNRQKGRHLCNNVFQVDNNLNDINTAWYKIQNTQHFERDSYYGDGNASARIVNYIKDYLYVE